MVAAALYSSASQEWRTPPSFFAALHRRYAFTLDAAASDKNALLPRYFTRQQNGLGQDWNGQRVWCNPPYGRQVGDWCRKAAYARALVVMLLPARTDTAYWHEYIDAHASTVYFVRGRLRFAPERHPAPFPSVVVVWDDSAPRFCQMRAMDRDGTFA